MQLYVLSVKCDKDELLISIKSLIFSMFAGDEPRSQEGDSTAVQVSCKILSRRRRRGTDTRHYAATFLSPGKKIIILSFISLFISLSHDFNKKFNLWLSFSK